jgi:pectinesterase
MKRFCSLVILLLCFITVNAQRKIIVAKDGTGNFKSIQEAVNSLTNNDSVQRIIFIRNGVYNERVFIDKSHISLIGESREKVILDTSQARDIWRCNHPDDWGVATLNLRGSDITLENMTISNSYGFNDKGEQQIQCASDSNKIKTVRKDGHQMALRSFSTTRLIVKNCLLKAFGGDTVSPWNVEEGLFFFKDCTMEGGVDFYCPRGWAWAENCKFIAHSGPASIWHDGSKIRDSKTVLVNCSFEGFDGFMLGRYHRDAQFYLLNCSFAANMADKPIYLVPTNNTIQWGERIYFYNCHRVGGKDFNWYTDNLQTAEGKPTAAEITSNWVFGDKWKPGN